MIAKRRSERGHGRDGFIQQPTKPPRQVNMHNEDTFVNLYDLIDYTVYHHVIKDGVEDATFIISGGKSQGIKVGDVYAVIQKGKTTKNPQTGMMIELPGKPVGKIKIDLLGGETVDSEYSIVSFVEGSIDTAAVSNYYIAQIK